MGKRLDPEVEMLKAARTLLIEELEREGLPLRADALRSGETEHLGPVTSRMIHCTLRAIVRGMKQAGAKS